jgi:DNA-directed RNA polymerase specialized sigma24 family protein
MSKNNNGVEHVVEDHLDMVLDVIARLRTKPYGFMTSEDVSQEAFIIAQKVIKKWDGVRSLEHFLMASISRRLISLSRVYYRNTARRAAIDFLELDDQPVDDSNDIERFDEVSFVLDNLPIAMRSDYLRWANGIILPATRRESLIAKVKELYENR